MEALMFEIKTIINVAKKKEMRVSRKDNAMVVEYVNCEMSAFTTNILIKGMDSYVVENFNPPYCYKESPCGLEGCKGKCKNKPKFIFQGNFQQILNDVHYCASIYNTIMEAKKEHFSESRKSDVMENLRAQFGGIHRHVRDLITDSKLS